MFHFRDICVIIGNTVKKEGGNMLKLYSNIKHYRELRKMTQEELARKIGYANRSAVARIEKGDFDLPQSKIMAIADALDVTPGELMGEDGTSDEPVTEHYDFYLTGVKDFVEMDSDTNEKAMMVQRLFTYMKKLNAAGIEKLIERSEELTDMQKYRKEGDENVMD
jgi:transcriptional regulator with XRE-family HTH domain